MGASAAQFEFAAEIVALLVALAGLALVLLRAGLFSSGAWRAVGLGAGFIALGTAAFVHGALTPQSNAPSLVVGLRLLAAAVLVVTVASGARTRARASARAASGVGAPSGARRRAGRRGAGVGGLAPTVVIPGALLVAASAVAAYRASTVVIEALLLAGALLIGLGIALASRGSIGARLTATAAGTLLLIVVVLSVALSTVLSDTVRNDAVTRLQGRADRAAAAAGVDFLTDLADAKVVSSSIEGLGLAQPALAERPGAQSALQSGLTDLSTEFFSNVSLEWVTAGRAEAVSPGFGADVGDGTAAALAASNLVVRSESTGGPGGSSGVVAGRALAVGVYADSVGGRVVGVAVAVSPLGSSFLDSQIGDDPTLSAVLVTGAHVISAYPAKAARQDAQEISLARADEAGHDAPSITSDGRYAAGAPVLAGNAHTIVMALVAETPTSAVDTTRQSLFRTLFLIALGGSIIAFLLSVIVSDRINRGLGQLTAAAQRISTGETLVRTGIESDDEVGVLSAAFDSMAESIEEQAQALRRAALDEAALRSRLESVVSGMGEALVAVDAAGRVTEMNPVAEQLLGRQRGRAIGRAAQSLIDVRLDDGTELTRRIGAALSKPLAAQGMLLTRRGEVPVSVSAAPYRTGTQELPGTVLLMRDMRPERELERMKTEFLSRVGHELRTPLTAILGFVRLLAGRPVPPAQAAMLHNEILEQSNRLLRTVQMLEFFASAGANRLGLSRQRVAPRSLVESVAVRWSERLAGSHELRWRASSRLPEVDADERWIGLALDELIDNAVKFSPDGGRITVEAARTEEDGVSITVADRGQGMSEETLRDAFGEFVQGDSSDTRRFGGLGLGLPLAQRVAEAHGGRIEATSRPGRGSRFVVVLPPAERQRRRRRQRSQG